MLKVIQFVILCDDSPRKLMIIVTEATADLIQGGVVIGFICVFLKNCLMWTFLKVCIEFVTILFLFSVLIF